MQDSASCSVAAQGGPPIAVAVSQGLVPYPTAVAAMEAQVAGIRAGTAEELVWFLEHPPIYTAGTSAKPADLIAPDRFPVFKTGRGGQYTYHGPGQRVIYAMVDLAFHQKDVRCHVHHLEGWAIAALARFGVQAERREGRVGLWVARDGGREEKIAAVGVRVRQWVTYHGMAINLAPELSHFGGIVPCGISEHGVTSLAALGKKVTMAELDRALMETFAGAFGRELVPGTGPALNATVAV